MEVAQHSKLYQWTLHLLFKGALKVSFAGPTRTDACAKRLGTR